MVGSLSGAEYTPTIETLEIEEDYFYIQNLVYYHYPEETTPIIYKIWKRNWKMKLNGLKNLFGKLTNVNECQKNKSYLYF